MLSVILFSAGLSFHVSFHPLFTVHHRGTSRARWDALPRSSPILSRAKSSGKGFGGPSPPPPPPKKKKRSAPSSSDEGVPSIQELAQRQRAAVILQENWATVSERLGGLLSGDMVKASQSSVHGVGVFAARDLSEGELIALHPVDRVLQQIGGGRVAGALADEDDAAYFRPAADAQPPVSAEELAYRQVAYRKIYSHVNPQRPDSFLLDANPTKPDVTGWLGHRINDGAYLSPGADEEAILQYYAESGKARNVCCVALCVPLLAFVTTRPVADGDELLATYGHTYWTQSTASAGEVVDSAFGDAAREADLWQVSVDKKHSQKIMAIDDFIGKVAAAESADAE